MAQHPAPTISDNLLLVTQRLTHSAVGHVAQLTFACVQNVGANPQTNITNIQDFFATNLKNQLDTQCVIEKPTALVGDGTNVPGFVIGGSGPTAGTTAKTLAPPQVAALLKKTTAFAGKKNRGRLYLPFALDVAAIDEDGRIDGTVLAALQAKVTLFFNAIAANNIPMVIANKVLVTDPVTHKPYVTDITLGELVTALTVEDVVATQRRRLKRQ